MPPIVVDLARRCREAGGRALLVGGPVRDYLRGKPVKDWDIEVYGLSIAALEELLSQLGKVNLVGRSFGVYKLASAQHDEIDVSVPRRDSKAGPGHRGIHVQGDPFLELREAARRRDLTINAILYDVLTEEVLDPFDGRADLQRGRLRAVDEQTFLEDPLRALRVAQFAARFDFTVDPSLDSLCRAAALDELPPERILGEWAKLLLLGARPSVGLAFARRTDILARVFPEAARADRPETDAALDRFATSLRDAVDPEGRRLAIGLAIWLHGASLADAEATCDRLGLHRYKAFPVRDRLLEAVAHWARPPVDDPALRHLSTQCELWTTLVVRGAVLGEAPDAWLLRAEQLHILTDKPHPLLQGRHLKDQGLKPGREMGRVLAAVYERQLDGTVTSLEEAKEAAIAVLGGRGRSDGGW